MIFFYGEGRIGNQIFQYQSLVRIAKPGERIVAVGLEDLQCYLELCASKVLVLNRNRSLKRLFKYLLNPFVFRPLAQTLRLCNYGSEGVYGAPGAQGANGELSIRAGLFMAFTFVEGGHYQNAGYWSSVFPASEVKLKASLRDAARRFLKPICTAGSCPAFVHVRRGDYLVHTDHGQKDFTLPADFYRSAIQELRSRIGDVHLVFVTDDPSWVAENFQDVERKSITPFGAAMDFAIMTECRAGVLSNSTFSLAAGLMMRDAELVIGPEYWFGFKVREWLPPKIRFEHPKFLYLPVSCPHPAADLRLGKVSDDGVSVARS